MSALKSNVKKESPKDVQTYFEGVGRRKAATARVRISPIGNSKAKQSIIVNEKSLTDYFSLFFQQANVLNPLKITSLESNLDVSVHVRGGGSKGQSEAIRLGLARALVKYDINLRKILKDVGFLMRDARVVERKKPGLKKARRAPQWQKR